MPPSDSESESEELESEEEGKEKKAAPIVQVNAHTFMSAQCLMGQQWASLVYRTPPADACLHALCACVSLQKNRVGELPPSESDDDGELGHPFI
jgi:hypothetical protein